KEIAALAKAAAHVPCAIGFGISTPEQARAMAQCADGVIVGSAIVKIIAQYGRDAVPHVADYVRSMKDAIR
ncbi:MAG: tryptophan synthase subunit alpha, partial [Oscillospiraceae bacterium]|nr:tryptophan synthase subunit alpha [Oscillospiraceae bacterium]